MHENFDVIHFRLESLYACCLIVHQVELLHLKLNLHRQEVMVQQVSNNQQIILVHQVPKSKR